MKSFALPFPKRILQDRSLPFNLAFFTYLVFLQPYLTRRLVGVMYQNRTDYFLAGLMLLVSLAELAAVILKTPAISWRMRQSESRLKTGLLPFILWTFHTVVGVSLAFFALQACGLDISDENHPTAQHIGFLVFGIAVIKELVILRYWAVLGDESLEEARGQAQPGCDSDLLARRELLGDILYFFYSAVAFTILWDILSLGMPINPKSPASILAGYFGAAFFFLILFLPIRGVYLFEEWQALRSRKASLWYVTSILLNLFWALTAIPSR